MKNASRIPTHVISQHIFFIRGQRVMIDRDLAELYGVETKYLNRQVRRNRARFPEEFMFRLTVKEKNELVTNWHRFFSLKHSNAQPYAFTEHGVAMLASVLNSKRAINMSILIIKVFVSMREIVSRQKELAQKVELLELKVGRHDSELRKIIAAIRHLMGTPRHPLEEEQQKPRNPMGFRVEEPKSQYVVKGRKNK
jgi:phage regulator Rha-like protein